MDTLQITKIDLPIGLSDEDVSAELIKPIRKLRWIGMEGEAEKIQQELRRFPAALCDSVLADPDGAD